MQPAINVGLSTLSPSQPNSIWDGNATNAGAARKSAARYGLIPVQTISAT
jgi:hypothetical protein